ncbi:hypothetical protein AB6D20_027820 (plasmid) [Vibrio splendidus]
MNTAQQEHRAAAGWVGWVKHHEQASRAYKIYKMKMAAKMAAGFIARRKRLYSAQEAESKPLRNPNPYGKRKPRTCWQAQASNMLQNSKTASTIVNDQYSDAIFGRKNRADAKPRRRRI